MLKHLLSTILIFFFSTVYGQKIETDRPDQTESSSTVPAKHLQIESGVLVGISEYQSTREQQILLPTTLFRLGLTKDLELRVLSQFENNQINTLRTNGISDLEIGAKIHLFGKETSRTKAAFIPHLVLPTGSSGLTNSNYGTISKVSISHKLSENLELGYNLGYNYFGLGNGDFTYSLVFGYDLNDKVGVYIEPFGEIAQLNNWFSNIDAGFTYSIKNNLQFDFSFGTGINYRMNYLSFGMSWISLGRK